MEGARAMSDAPKEIYYDPRDGYISGGIPPKHPAFASCTPYVRADLSASPEVVKELVEALGSLLSAVDAWAETPFGSEAEIAATGPIAEAAEEARAILAKLEGGE